MKKEKQEVFCGVDVIMKKGIAIQGKCGLITNHTGVLKDLSATTAEVLQKKCDLCALFGPEHGLYGAIQAGAETGEYMIDKQTGLPVYSLYGKGKMKAEAVLAGLDAVFFDMQDVGARFYTYAYTMTDAMALCAKHGIRFIVLDRPNPIGGLKAEGTILDRRFATSVGRFPTATRSGLTIGEFALLANETENIGCDLSVIACEGWKREMDFDDTDLIFVAPSPNLPTVDAAFCYIGTCIFEGTNVSEGRGTTKPFETIGAPWLDADAVLSLIGEQAGVRLRKTVFVPTFSKYAGVACEGISLHITDRDAFLPFIVGIRLLEAIRKTHKEMEITPFMKSLIGTDAIFSPDFDAEAWMANEAEKVARWQRTTEKIYIY